MGKQKISKAPCINCLTVSLCIDRIYYDIDRYISETEESYDYDLDLAYADYSFDEMNEYYTMISVEDYANHSCGLLKSFLDRFNDNIVLREKIINDIIEYMDGL